MDRRKMGGLKSFKKIGDEMNPSPDSKLSSVLTIVCYVVFGFLVLIVIAILALTSVLVSRTCPDCECDSNTTTLQQEFNKDDFFFYEKASISETLEAVTKISDDMRKCSNLCFDRFYECPLSTDPDNCKRKTMTLRDCPNFHKCLSECADICGLGLKSEFLYSTNLCINQNNEDIICPTSSGSNKNNENR
jgi:hypothetical protein